MTNSSFQNGVQFAWDSTSIKAAATCPRYYYYSLIEGIQPRITSVHLIFGALYAAALESFHKYRVLENMPYEDNIRRVVKETLLASWNSEENRPIEFAHSAKTRISLIRSIIWYLDEFAKNEGAMKTHILHNGKPAVEVSFSLDIDNDLVICGHLDQIVDYSEALWVMDQKTSGGAIGSYFFDGFKPDIQMSCYSWAGQILTESPIKGVIIDAAQIAVGGTNFARGFTTRTSDELDEWWESSYEVIQRTRDYTYQMENKDDPAQAFPMNTTACGNYGGCPFRKICSAAPRIRNAIIKQDYAAKVWDPLERR